ncbi:hypothetical protein [Streptomyces sp. NPDC097981]|uniref:hypothetical protein n=1 Tax=Streptomyces sp. NPDC097981 TaxID=3155428 RepID=UPI00332E38C1
MEIPGSGHLGNLERPEAVNAAILVLHRALTGPVSPDQSAPTGRRSPYGHDAQGAGP